MTNTTFTATEYTTNPESILDAVAAPDSLPTESQVEVVTLWHVDAGGGYTVRWDQIRAWLDPEIEESEPDDRFRMERRIMSVADFEAMPEFDGW